MGEAEIARAMLALCGAAPANGEASADKQSV
jgi:CPA2 family monovalent cation:H+ antiporter-2